MTRNLFLTWTLSLLCSQAMAQTSSQNYIVERKLQDANGTRAITTVTYYDDFGYPEETATTGPGANWHQAQRAVQKRYGFNEATEYFYDTNGALIKDLNKGISNIEYDVLGNLKCITFSNGFKTKYVYDADGTKLQTTHESVVTNTTDYAGNFVFEDGKLAKYLFDGGYCSFDTSLQPTYHYYEKDHLGSIRMVVNENGTIEQVNHYYPFGGVYGDLSYNSEYQRNKYIGKEFDHTDGLDWYDHGARMYDAARVAWDRREPLYDKYYRLNPYLYSGNNPINSIDEDGKRIIGWYKDKSGNDTPFHFCRTKNG